MLQAGEAAGSTAAALEGAPWPPSTPHAPPLPPESRRACACDAVAVREAVSRVQRGRTRLEASLLPLAHRRRRSMRCGAHLLVMLGPGRPVTYARPGVVRASPSGSGQFLALGICRGAELHAHIAGFSPRWSAGTYTISTRSRLSHESRVRVEIVTGDKSPSTAVGSYLSV